MSAEAKRAATQASKAVASKAVANKAVANKAVANKPVATKPVANKAVANKAVANKAVANKAVANKTVANKTVANKTVASKAVATKAVASKVVASKAVASKVASKVVASKVVASKAVASKVASKVVASKAVASKAVASKAVASKAVASKAVASKAVASKAVASKAVASKAVASKVVASKAGLRTHAAFLRGVMPTNCKMNELAAALERGGFAAVVTVRGSGNVLFGTDETDLAAIRARLEAAMERHLGRVFAAHVRSLDTLAALAARDPFASLEVRPGDKRDVTFLRSPRARALPAPRSGAAILRVDGDIALSTHTPAHPDGPVFMKLLSEAFGDDITTRTWETLLEVLAKR